MTRRPTLRDISEEAGVSVFAVSKAIAGKPGVSHSTRERILGIAESLGYVPNRLAAHLKGSTTRTIGVMSASGRNQYYAVLVQALDGVLQGQGYHAITSDAMRGGTYLAEVERKSVEELLEQRVGAVVATYSLAPESLDLLEKWEIPVVFVDSPPPESHAHYPFVGCDNYGASASVARYFGSLGLDSALYLAFPPEWNTRGPRERGFTETAAGLGMSVEIAEAENTSESAHDAIYEIFSKRPASRWPEAIYATNTLLLHGALSALKELDIDIPGSVSVLGFDEFDWSELVQPPMTVVNQHIDQIGRTAGEMVLGIVKDKDAAFRSRWVEVQPELVIRKSCASRS
jgi:LacI family transcriptional regulator